jgi:hypothetical protein
MVAGPGAVQHGSERYNNVVPAGLSGLIQLPKCLKIKDTVQSVQSLGWKDPYEKR